MFRARAVRVLIFFALLCPMPALAQLSPLIVDQNRADKNRAAPLPQMPVLAPVQAPPQGAAPAAAFVPFTLRRVEVAGSSLLPEELAAATQSFVGTSIDGAALSRLTQALSALYAGSDIALYTILVPGQNFAGGDLQVVVQEGYVEHVELHGETGGDFDLIKSYGEKLVAEKPLRKSTLQRYVSFMRDVQGVTPDVQLLRGTEPGATLMSIGITTTSHKLSFAIDDQGTEALGRIQLETDAEFYSLLREGDVTRLTLSAPTQFNRFQYIALTQSQPLDGDGTTAQVGASYLRTRPKGVAIDGNAQTLQLVVSHAFVRSFDENLIASVSVDGLNASDATIGNLLSTDRTRAARFVVSYSLGTPDSFLQLTTNGSLGLAVLGARIDSAFGGDRAFRKAGLQALFNQRLSDELTLRVRAVGQYAGNRLPSSEVYALGGADIGAAFPTASVFGDSVAGGRVELGYAAPWMPQLVAGTEVYAFADGAVAWLRARPNVPAQQFDIASAGGGIRLHIGTLTTLDVEGATGIIADAPGLHTGDWRVSFALTTKAD